jgi:hypothetical protein
MEAIYSSETSGFTELHGVSTQYVVTAVRTSDPADRVFEKRDRENIQTWDLRRRRRREKKMFYNELHNFCLAQNVIVMVKSRRIE